MITDALYGAGLAEDVLAYWSHLDTLGVPLLVSRPNPAYDGSNVEFFHPTGWSSFTADGNAERLARYQPGDAVLGVMGGEVAAPDVDPRNGGDIARVVELLNGLDVRVFAKVITPGNGVHLIIAAHPSLATAHDLPGWPGVDIQATGALLFLPGTLRPKYAGAGYVIAEDNLDALADGGDLDGAEAFADWVDSVRPHREPENVSEPWAGGQPSPREQAYLDGVLRGAHGRLTVLTGGRNNALVAEARACGHYVAGAGLDEQQVIDTLLDASRINELVKWTGERAVLATINSGLTYGKKTPTAVPDEEPVLTYRVNGVEQPIRRVETNGSMSDSGESSVEVDPVATQVQGELHKLRVRAEARRLFDVEQTAEVLLPPSTRLDRFLDEPDDPVVYRIDRLWPAFGRVVLAAPHKSGKSTLTGNVLRSLADGDPFLDTFEVQPARRIVLVDDELSPSMMRRWLGDQAILNTDRIDVVSLRGALSTFNLLDPTVRARWAERLTGFDVLLLDCLRPLLDALGLSENNEAGRFLAALDDLLGAAGIAESLVVHHTGHAGERARGDSRILDWPDALWKLLLPARDQGAGERDTDGPVDLAPATPRYFRAYGRDVEQPEVAVIYDPDTRRLSIGNGTRRDHQLGDVRARIVAHVAANPEVSGNGIQQAIGGHAPNNQRVLRECVATGVLIVEQRGRGKHYTLNPAHSTSSTVFDQSTRSNLDSYSTPPYRGSNGRTPSEGGAGYSTRSNAEQVAAAHLGAVPIDEQGP